MNSNRFLGAAFVLAAWICTTQLSLAADQIRLPDELVSAFTEARVITSYTSDVEGPAMFVYGPVDKIKRQVFFEEMVRAHGKVSSVLIELTAGTDRRDLSDWFTNRVDQEGFLTLYSCDGQDCGRATIWANEIFKVRELSAPNRNQAYVAVSIQDGNRQILAYLYVVARGNRRVVAYLTQIDLGEPIRFDDDIADRLMADGMIQLPVPPKVNGNISDEDLETLARMASDFDVVSSHRVFVVCHMHGPGDPDEIIKSSELCAEKVAQVIAENSTLNPTPIGIGPLVPINGRGVTRVELVVPGLLKRD